jgi:hypothetical protein
VFGDEQLVGPWIPWLKDQLHCPVEAGRHVLDEAADPELPLPFAAAVGLLYGTEHRGTPVLDFVKEPTGKGGGPDPLAIAEEARQTLSATLDPTRRSTLG